MSWRKTGIRSRRFLSRKIPKGGRFAAAMLVVPSRVYLGAYELAQDRNPLAQIPVAQDP